MNSKARAGIRRFVVPALFLGLAGGVPSAATDARGQEPDARGREPGPLGAGDGALAAPLPDGLRAAAAGDFAPDTPEPESIDAIRRHTTAERYLPPLVSYVPESPTVPSPTDVLGRIAGAANELSSVAEIHDYFRRLDAASDRVVVRTIGTSEEGREIVLAIISSEENLRDLERYRDLTVRLADPRRTSREEAQRLAALGKPIYYLLAGLHSTETGSPEMVMELAYRLAVSERPEIRSIRENLIVLITPVVETDGRDRVVEWYYRHLRDRVGPWSELRAIGSPPYWGHYAYHDNNRDGMQLTLALTRAVHETFYEFHPQVVHDLHESLPLLYISTGHGPYSPAIDPVTINEWTQFAHHEASELQAQGMPGVWTWAFWDGWWPGYLFSVANNHNAIGRFYETFGNSLAGTFVRELDEIEYLDKPVTTRQWYRPWPPDSTVVWSLRNNTNYMQAGVLQALQYAALHGEELLWNFWVKGDRALERGRTEAPYAWAFPVEQRDPSRLAYLIELLRRHRIEVHRLTADATIGDSTLAAGTYVVRMDQPFRNAALTFLDRQEFPEEEPNPPYDDVAWTWPLLYGVEGRAIGERGILEAAMAAVTGEVTAQGGIRGAGDVYALEDTGQTGLLAARVRLANHRIEAAERAFTIGIDSFPAGSWIVSGSREELERVAGEFGLDFVAAAGAPDVRRHAVDLPRLAVYQPWSSTQDAGWVRYTFDRMDLPYTLITDEDLERDRIGRYDVILIPDAAGDFARLVHGIDPKYGPLAYTRTDATPSHGIPNSSEDITGGMGFAGLLALQRFVEQGGVLVTLGNAGRLVVDGGIVRHVRHADGEFNTPGSELRARVLRPDHPLAYGYQDSTSVFRGKDPLWEVDDRYRDWVVVQFGTKEIVDADRREARAAERLAKAGERGPEPFPPPDFGMPVTERGERLDAAAAEDEKGTGKDDGDEDAKDALLLSGFIDGADEVDGKPAILDIPVGKGRVLLFAFNPLHRFLNHSDFRFAFNAILHWNDLPRR
ncbi:MAG TPA: M14 family zinc carboxypeptidase [Gemmatimonadota bacterium]|nr:M14 family zinc carboxypeptidase [Gemmatimonadota bacterium]